MIKDLMHMFATKLSTSDVSNIPVESADTIIYSILQVVYYAAGVVSVLVIIIAGFMMVVQGNAPEKIAMRKKAIGLGVAGLAIVLLAFTITQWIVGKF